MRRRSKEFGGSTLLEFTLVGIPVLFALISIFELSRGMWLYHTIGYAIKAGTRYAIVHGEHCAPPHACTKKIRDIAAVMQAAGAGLDPAQFDLTFQPQVGSAINQTLAASLVDNTVWPPMTSNTVGMKLTISGTYPFRSIISMFWPGAGAVQPYTIVNFPAASTERVQF